MEGLNDWSDKPTPDLVYFLSLALQNARGDFYQNLRYWVEDNGAKELRLKVRMTEKNFMARITQEAFTPAQIKAIMKDIVKEYPANMYGHDISNEEERVL